jgi:hypothetical protein
MKNLLAVKIDGTNFEPANNFTNIPSVVSKLLPNVFLLAGIIFTCIFIYAGFKFLNAGDSPDELSKIRNMLLTSGVGMAIIFGSYFIMKIIGSLLNIALPF